MKPVLHVMEFLIATTLIFNSTNPGRFNKFCKSSGPSTSKDTSVYYPLVMVFASTFPFTVFSLLVILHVFAGLCI
jgi:hypothetical protein